MLIILVGGTLEVGKNSRTYFEKTVIPKSKSTTIITATVIITILMNL